jgi:hypothetical protein
MIKYPINKEQADTIPFQVNGVITHGGKKIDTLFICHAKDNVHAKELLKKHKETNYVKYNMRTLSKQVNG